MMDLLPEHEEAFHNILDCFTCADGCKRLVQFKLLVEDMDARAHDCSNEDGNNAYQVLHSMRVLSKLIDIANKEEKE